MLYLTLTVITGAQKSTLSAAMKVFIILFIFRLVKPPLGSTLANYGFETTSKGHQISLSIEKESPHLEDNITVFQFGV